MCFVALLYQQVPDYPIVLGANRDERPDRPGLHPQPLRPGIRGGKDPRHGGTWLGVSTRGGIAAITNRHAPGTEPDPQARSRGLLCLDILEQTDPGQMRDALSAHVERHSYNPFSLLFGSGSQMWIASWDRTTLHASELEPGIHVLGNGELNDANDPKVMRGHALIEPEAQLQPTLNMLIRVCADHGTRCDGEDAICVHGAPSRTLSCSVLAIHANTAAQNQYLHGQGPPCRTALLDYSPLFDEAATSE